MSEVHINLPNGWTIEWVGERGLALRIIDLVKSAAGSAFDALAHDCLKTATLRESEPEGEEDLAILAFVLERCTGDQEEYPGRFVEYLDSTDFEFNVDVDDEGEFDISGRPTRFTRNRGELA
jgi:hypothetical protein